MTRWRIGRVLFVITAIGLLLLPTHQSNASPEHATRYYVYTDCNSCMLPGGIPCNTLTGEWTETCWGNWYGWGDQPGAACTWTDVVELDNCYGD